MLCYLRAQLKALRASKLDPFPTLDPEDLRAQLARMQPVKKVLVYEVGACMRIRMQDHTH